MHSQPRPIRQDSDRTAYRERISREPTIVEWTIFLLAMLLLARWLVVGPVGATVSTAIDGGLVVDDLAHLAQPIGGGPLPIALARGGIRTS